MKYLANAFSLQMLHGDAVLHCSKCDKPELSTLVSAVGHKDTAAVLGVECNRINLSLSKGDELYVAQLVGGRLPEGTTALPEGFKFVWWHITLD